MTGRPTTLITGATGGLGSALASEAARAGHDLILTGRDSEALAALAAGLHQQHGVLLLTVEADLSHPDGADHLYNQVIASGWNVDHLINNAGFATSGPVATTPPSALQDLVLVNVQSGVTLTRLFLPAMLARKSGGILNVASIAAFQPGPLMAAYYASKAFVLSFTEALAAESASSGVRISCLCPGPISTGFAHRAHLQGSRLFRRNVQSAETVARIGWKGFSRGRRLIFPGWRNRLLARISPFIPHAISLPVVRWLHRD